MILTLEFYKHNQFRSIRLAAASFNVPHQRPADHVNKIAFRPETQPNYQRLTSTEEKTIVRHILDLYLRRFAPPIVQGGGYAK